MHTNANLTSQPSLLSYTSLVRRERGERDWGKWEGWEEWGDKKGRGGRDKERRGGRWEREMEGMGRVVREKGESDGERDG